MCKQRRAGRRAPSPRPRRSAACAVEGSACRHQPGNPLGAPGKPVKISPPQEPPTVRQKKISSSPRGPALLEVLLRGEHVVVPLAAHALHHARALVLAHPPLEKVGLAPAAGEGRGGVSKGEGKGPVQG